MSIQYITNETGERISVVVPIGVFEKLLQHNELEQLKLGKATESLWHDVSKYPKEVISIFSARNCSMQAAWRIYRGMTQNQVAQKLGITQASVSEFEKSLRPRQDNLERLAVLYQCRPEQLVFE